MKIFLKERQVKEIDEQIHIAWLCIAEPSRRVQDSEKELYDILNKYTQGHTIVVITKAKQDKNPKGEKFSDVVKKLLNIKEESHFQRVHALSIEDDDGNKTDVKGLKIW